MGPCLDTNHDLDLDRVTDVPDGFGCYDNGWQLVHIWCRTHERWEWQFVDYDRLLQAAGRLLDELLAKRWEFTRRPMVAAQRRDYGHMATDWDPDDMAKVAVHEAGHALVAWLFGIPLKRIYLDLNSQGGAAVPDVDVECAARLNLLQAIAVHYAGPVSERTFGGPPNQNTERRADHDNKMASLMLDRNGTAPFDADGLSLKARAHSRVEELLRRHESRIRRVAKRLLQPPHKMNPARFKRLMREGWAAAISRHQPG
jgi:hypothetical protein